MFAFTTASDGDVRAARLEAVTDADERVRVPLEPASVGLRRAEIEGQLGRVVARPELLRGLASAYAPLHPGAPRFVQMDVVTHVVRLRAGVAAGESDTVVATWRGTTP